MTQVFLGIEDEKLVGKQPRMRIEAVEGVCTMRAANTTKTTTSTEIITVHVSKNSLHISTLCSDVKRKQFLHVTEMLLLSFY